MLATFALGRSDTFDGGSMVAVFWNEELKHPGMRLARKLATDTAHGTEV